MYVPNREHVTRLEYRGTWARWICTCGRRSKLFGFGGLAESAGEAHVKALGVKRV
jgi:hypothetical protein